MTLIFTIALGVAFGMLFYNNGSVILKNVAGLILIIAVLIILQVNHIGPF